MRHAERNISPGAFPILGMLPHLRETTLASRFNVKLEQRAFVTISRSRGRARGRGEFRDQVVLFCHDRYGRVILGGQILLFRRTQVGDTAETANP